MNAPSFRFLKTQRLLHPAQYRNTITTGHRSIDQLFATYAGGNGLTNARIGITVSRRVSQRAVERNRIKRVIRESFRHNQTHLAGLDIVTIARAASKVASTKQLTASLERHWNRVEYQCKSL